MKVLPLFTLFLCAALSVRGDTDRNPAPSDNVNSRYTVESVTVAGKDRERLSKQLKEDLESVVGQKFEQGIVDNLAARIKQELHAASVSARLSRGTDHDHVKINFEIRVRKLEEEADLTKFSYHSQQGWTGGVEAGFHVGPGQVKVGVQSDGDQLLERYAGINTLVSVPVGQRVRVRFGLESFHEQWNAATIQALNSETAVPGIYRTRTNYEPSIQIALTNTLSLTAGVSFEELQVQFPAARTEGAHALITTLRYHRQWGASDTSGQELDAGYSLRAATRVLDSDYIYTRHLLNASYSRRWNRQEVLVRFGAGNISGQAPLFERFVLGNSKTLRGWNKFDLDPLGGSRTVYGSTSYRYRILEVFYDTGSVWDQTQSPVARNSVGFSIVLGSLRDGLAFTVGFPLREGRVQPLFIMSANF
jgi:outer membrane translocation and assembly module TamA